MKTTATLPTGESIELRARPKRIKMESPDLLRTALEAAKAVIEQGSVGHGPATVVVTTTVSSPGRPAEMTTATFPAPSADGPISVPSVFPQGRPVQDARWMPAAGNKPSRDHGIGL